MSIPASLDGCSSCNVDGLERPLEKDEVTVTSPIAASPTPVLAGEGLDRSGGQQDIIPLPVRLTPHTQHKQHNHRGLDGQLPLPSLFPPYNKGPAQPGPRATAGCDPDLSTTITTPPAPPTMLFSDLYRSPRSPFSKLRAHPHAVAVPPDLDADLVCKDKARQKEAVKRFLAEKVRNDWDFTWPPTEAQPAAAVVSVDAAPVAAAADDHDLLSAGDHEDGPRADVLNGDAAPRDPGEEADSESDGESVYSTVSEDPAHFRPRAEWTSDLSDDDEPRTAASPFRFDNPDSVGAAVTTSILKRRALRRRAVREEATWNVGLACFEARRNAWTGAKTARIKPKPPNPISPSSTRRLSFWRHHRTESTASHNGGFSSGSPPAVSSPLSPTATRTSQQTDASTPPSDHDSGNSLSRGSTGSGQKQSSHEPPHSTYAVETLLPLAPPLIPPQNVMRATVTPSIYPALYDKIVVQNLQPQCPVNLADMLRACVVGWKRDGEWPPRSTAAAPILTATDLAAIRHRKAQQEHARRSSNATAGTSRRMSFVGFLGGKKDDKEKEKDKGSGGNGSDETSGKGIRRSLQKVFSLGHEHAHGPMSPMNTANTGIPDKDVAPVM